MTQNYPELKGKCKTCLGCNQLELKEFRGVYECKNYKKGVINDRNLKFYNNKT